jgi:hypothetical protein
VPNAVRFWFGAKSVHETEAAVRALAEGRPPNAVSVEKDAKLPHESHSRLVPLICATSFVEQSRAFWR